MAQNTHETFRSQPPPSAVDIMDLYLADIRQYPPHAVNGQNYKEVLGGAPDDPRTRERLILTNTALAFDRTIPLWPFARRKGWEPLDLIGRANIELIRLGRKYDPEKGTAFSSYATPSLDFKLRQFLFSRSKKNPDMPTDSLDEINKEKESDRHERIAGNSTNPETVFLEKERKEEIRKALEQLPPRQMWTLLLRYGFDDRIGQQVDTTDLATLEDVGHKLGYTKGRIEQFEKMAFRQLQHNPSIGRMRR